MPKRPFGRSGFGGTVPAMFTKLRGRGRLAGIAAVIPLALGLAIAGGQPAAAAPALNYVALGDSYTAGQGGGAPYDECLRTEFGYPAQVHALPSIDLISLPACAGATTSSVRTQQLPARADFTVRLVTLTVGGNDLGFYDVGRYCPTDPVKCTELLTVTRTEALTLFSNLVKTYWAVKAKFPVARVVVLTYPRLFVPGFEVPGEVPSSFTAAVNAAGDAVHKVIVAAARISPVTLVDVRDEFRDHAIGSPEPWIDFSAEPTTTLHPNAIGYRQGYFQALVNAGVVPPQ